jgi:hypothetical protein
MIPSYTECIFFLEFEDDAAVANTKTQGQNERFEVDVCWCGFRMNMSAEGPSAYVTLLYMI